MKTERPFYFKLAGHCTRCHETLVGNASFMVSESVVLQVIGDEGAITGFETVPVCAACATDKEQAAALLALTCKGCGLAMRVAEWHLPERGHGLTCSSRCAQQCAGSAAERRTASARYAA